MLKFVIGVIVGMVARPVLLEAYEKQSFPYKRRIENIYLVARYGCDSPMSHNYGCKCVKENESR